MITYKKKLISALAALSVSATAFAAGPVTVVAKIDSTTMRVGGVTNVRVTVVQDKGAIGQLIVPADSLVENVEIAGKLNEQKNDIGNGREQIDYALPVQPFAPGDYLLPPMQYISGNDTLKSEKIALKVTDIDVSDLEQLEAQKKKLYDYKDLENPDRKFWDFLPESSVFWWIVIGIIVLAALGLGGYYVYRRRKQGLAPLPFLAKKPLLPPYEEAVKALSDLKRRQLWQNGDAKGYYTELTDILRRFLWRRFGVGAMEMTSSQILEAVAEVAEIQATDGLEELLATADFVKFAKMAPLAAENEKSFIYASKFVDSNKPVEPVAEEKKDKPTKE